MYLERIELNEYMFSGCPAILLVSKIYVNENVFQQEEAKEQAGEHQYHPNAYSRRDCELHTLVSRNSCTRWVPGFDVMNEGLSLQTIAGCRTGPTSSKANVQDGSL